jgi:hypothetical protein
MTNRSFHIDTNFPVFISRARIAEKMAASDGYWALDAILNSAIALEAYPNDLVGILRTPYEMGRKFPEIERLPEPLVNVYRIIPSIEQVASQTKYQILYHLLSGKTFDEGTQPFQDFTFLLTLRNEIVHPKCEAIEHGVEEPYEKVTRRLVAGIRSRNLSHIPQDHHLFWKRHLENSKAATWAVNTARAMVTAITDAIPDCSTKRGVLSSVVGKRSSLNRKL